MSYPHGTDCGWLACDGSGRLAVLITAGRGPIPKAAVDCPVEIEEHEDLLLALPAICETRLLPENGDTSSFAALGNRGLFVYDWKDVHRSRGFKHAYELVATPDTLLKLEDLPPEVRSLAVRVAVSLGGPLVEVVADGAVDWVWPDA